MTISEVLNLITKVMGARPRQIRTRQDIQTTGPYLYVVANGPHILQIGQTSGGENGGRLVSLLNGARPGIHNKSFIVGLGHAVLSDVNTFYLFECPPNQMIKTVENKVHEMLGIHTNESSAVLINGQPAGSISAVNLWLWQEFEKTDIFMILSEKEKSAARDLYQLVDSSFIEVTRSSGRSQKYRSGDMLCGSILKSANLSGFCNLWQKMCRKYFHYTDYYLLDEMEYERFLETYKIGYKAPSVSKPKIIKQTNDILDFDLEITRSQLQKAFDLIVLDPEVYKQCKTADIQLQTNHDNYIFLITRPTQGERNKLAEALERTPDEVIVLNNLELQKRNTEPVKYKTDFPMCYVQYSKSGYNNKGKRWIDKD